ncbi:MAG TPA: NAD(P)H-dependent oxidoreductase [Candidatus Limiplasma sp.]|nr:NAD(P)H-dependent oxidoreductase [Candidatus Limiplasma sp.]HPS81945.1 NAD(P)H-dependent oxidoreductase [Candidatus Limiplasma sp.]
MSQQVIGIVVGSIRNGSYSRSVANYIASQSTENVSYKILEIGNLPLYNQDLDTNPPKEWVGFREQVKALDGVLFITPEHNRSLPAALKNALDIASRPYGSSVWNGKPGGIISVSPGALGGFGANHHLRQVLTFLNVLTLQQPEAYLGNITVSLDENGVLVSENLKAFLHGYLESLTQWVSLIASAK